jgi:hypothetical protein
LIENLYSYILTLKKRKKEGSWTKTEKNGENMGRRGKRRKKCKE